MLGALSTADVQRCKLAFIKEKTCDPDLTAFGQFYEWAFGSGVSVGVNCLDQQDKYYACVAAGIPPPPAPAPPPIPSTPAGWNDPTLPDQADAATRKRYADYWAATIPGYFSDATSGPTGDPNDTGDGTFHGIPTWVLIGAAAVVVFSVVRR